MNIIVVIVLAALFWIVMCELVSFLVYGRLVKEHRLDSYFTPERLDSIELNPYNSSNNLFYDPNGRFIAKVIFSLTAKWYIHDIGLIPRWSKWSRTLEEKRSLLIDKAKHQ